MSTTADLSGQVAIISGASSGIGRATARLFARAGATLALLGRDGARLETTAEACRSLGSPRVEEIEGDLTADKTPADIVERVMANLERLDILVNAAGIIGSGLAAETSDETFDGMMDINVRSLFRLTRASIPHLEKTSGNIVNVSSVAGLRPYPGLLPYCVSKAAVDQMTRCLSLELGPRGVRVNAVNPGVVVTNLHRAGGMDEDAYQTFLERGDETHPLGRVGQPEEVAELILFLASSKAAWITGTTMSIDGGRAQTSLR
ncbi:MAG: glucose 1-dehydrogenase [Acidobacteria bacterium]|nr:MAG: glucose 1-dehydrogenase [Acidobacteriota bacterium]TDI41414.1 MAG: glucose 1-dehydrogenase [Acidobacteriota bacterium]